MEEMEETMKSEAHLTSAAAFVEGGIQDACDDACSICLEAFCDSDPSTVTNCKHEFHLQCVLEWCQRSSQCPMCWQPISLKDAMSQELLEAVERERSFKLNPSRNTTIFHHPTLGDFELQHLPVGANEAELEERIIQHLAAAAAMGRRHMARREGQRNRSASAQGRPQFLVFTGHPNSPPASSISSPSHVADSEHVATITVATPSCPPTNRGEESPQPTTSSNFQANHASALASGSNVEHGNSSNNRRSPIQSSPSNEDRAGPSEFQSFSDSIRSKFNAVSMRYKESISKSTRGWKEKFFSRNTTMADFGSEVRREVNAGIATVSRLMEHLETKDNGRHGAASVPNRVESDLVRESNNQQVEDRGASHIDNTTANVEAPSATSSGSN